MRSTVIRYLALSIDLHGVGGYVIEPVGKGRMPMSYLQACREDDRGGWFWTRISLYIDYEWTTPRYEKWTLF